MSRKRRKHIRGKRGEAFLQIVRGMDRARILCVSLDISKYFSSTAWPLRRIAPRR